MKKKNIFCTVFTPTYNRLYTIKKLYESLQRQTDSDFEWVVVDDGSEDGTDHWFHKIEEPNFSITYTKVENGGKHRAINKGLDLARGRVFAIVDSDDYLADDAISTLKKMFGSIEDNSDKYCGVAGIKVREDGSIIGTTFEEEYVDAKSTERKRYNINGDKFEVFYTDILRNNKFPEIDGEKFLTEAVVWYRLSRMGYYIRWFNEPLYICEYLDDGLTSKQVALYSNNPEGYALFISERIENDDISLFEKMIYICNYYDVRREHASIKEIAGEINQTIAAIEVSRGVRWIYRIIKR